ncbi:glycosyltransferase family 2 protein [Leifsonia sp. Le1]|uniref:glycosyltransferase family 2 protein n=1 Tax=Leifsonia sp. Le1 TaxID=3404918 RepID=UPI003EBA0BAC
MPEHEKVTVGAVVVAYNSEDLLAGCVTSIAQDPQVVSIVVVDNSSSPAARAVVDGLDLPDGLVTYVDPGANLGFARGCNLGAASAGSVTHLAFVNPDVRLTRPLSELARAASSSGSAVTAGLLVSPTTGVASNTRALASWRHEFAKAIVGSRAYVGSSVQPSQESEPVDVGQVDGALLVIAAQTFERLNGFDERFELYYEDVDLCARAHAAGRVTAIPHAWGDHVGGASSASASTTSYCLSRISRIRYFRKAYGPSGFTRLRLLCLGVTEFLARSLTRQGEGQRTRRTSLAQQRAELRSPGSVRLLG